MPRGVFQRPDIDDPGYCVWINWSTPFLVFFVCMEDIENLGRPLAAEAGTGVSIYPSE